MADLNFYVTYKRILRELAEADPPKETTLGLGRYDQALTDFLKAAKAVKGVGAEQKLLWHLMRAGIRSELNDLQSKVRSELKAPHAPRNHEKSAAALRAHGARVRAENKRFAEIASALPTQEEIVDRLRRHVDEEASRRATEILNNWLCDGVPLGKCTGKDLDRLVKKEIATAVGHENNARFYTALREHTADDATVEQSVPANFVVEAVSSVFGQPAMQEAAE
jgi:hypothetical protein